MATLQQLLAGEDVLVGRTEHDLRTGHALAQNGEVAGDVRVKVGAGVHDCLRDGAFAAKREIVLDAFGPGQHHKAVRAAHRHAVRRHGDRTAVRDEADCRRVALFCRIRGYRQTQA